MKSRDDIRKRKELLEDRAMEYSTKYANADTPEEKEKWKRKRTEAFAQMEILTWVLDYQSR